MWASFKAHVGLISLALQENQNISRAPTLSSITVMLDIQQIDVGSMYWLDRSLLDQSVSNASGVFSTGELREANDTAHSACVLRPHSYLGLSGTWTLQTTCLGNVTCFPVGDSSLTPELVLGQGKWRLSKSQAIT